MSLKKKKKKNGSKTIPANGSVNLNQSPADTHTHARTLPRAKTCSPWGFLFDLVISFALLFKIFIQFFNYSFNIFAFITKTFGGFMFF